MSANSGVNFKAHLNAPGEEVQVKRFFVDADAVTSFVFLKEKLKNVFPSLHGTDFKITWKDLDADYVLISNDDDLLIALCAMQDATRVLYITSDPLKDFNDPPEYIPKVVCDVCQKHITGYRYKCLECPDYDLCAVCEGNGNHSEHVVIRLANGNIPFARIDRKMFHHAARALKKSACAVAKEAHRFGKEGFRSDKEKHGKCGEHANFAGKTNPGTSSGCPFSSGEPLKDIVQNINPLIEMFTRGLSNPGNTNEAPNNPIADIVKSFMDAMTNVSAEPDVIKNKTQENSTNPSTNPTEPTTETTNQPNVASNQNVPPRDVNQEMEWTILNEDQDVLQQGTSQEASKTPSAPSSVASAPPTQVPTPPQDMRLMRGLAQLHEMGFSNENNFLKYLLEANDYNVSKVVKAILEL